MLPVNGPTEEAKCEDLEKIVVGDDPEKFFHVRTQLPPQKKEKLIESLRRNIDVFAWNAYETFRVNQDFICHHLNVNLVSFLKKQPP